jgi:hypothetical protein
MVWNGLDTRLMAQLTFDTDKCRQKRIEGKANSNINKTARWVLHAFALSAPIRSYPCQKSF